MRETGVLTGLFDESELDSNNVKVSFIFPYIKTCFVKLRFPHHYCLSYNYGVFLTGAWSGGFSQVKLLDFKSFLPVKNITYQNEIVIVI